MAKKVLDHCEAMHAFLQGASSAWQEQARIKAKMQLEHLLSGVSMTMQEAAEINAQLQSMKMDASDIEELQGLVISCVQCAASAPRTAQDARRSLQDYTQLAHYIDENMWAELLCKETSQNNKLNALLLHCMKLGLQLPSEPTYQAITALFLVVAEGKDKVAHLSPAVRHETYKSLKTTFKRLLSRSGHTGPFVSELPLQPAAFLKKYPTWHACAFGDGGPALSKLQHSELMTVASMIPMRASRQDAKQPMQVQVNSSSDMPFGQMAQFGNCLLQQMQQMQKVQQMTLQALQGMQTGAQLAITCPGLGSEEPVSETKSSNRVLARMLTRAALDDVVTPQSNGKRSPQSQEQETRSNEPKVSQNLGDVPEENTEVHGPAKRGKMSILDAAELVAGCMDSKASSKAKDKKDQKGEADGSKEQKGKGQGSKDQKGKGQGNKEQKGKGQEKEHKGKEPKKQLQRQTSAETHAKPEKQPFYCYERSRMQIMCRTGIMGPGQSHAIKYGEGGEAAAEAKAKKWVQSQRKLRKL